MRSIHYPSTNDWKHWASNPAAVEEEAKHNRQYHIEGQLHRIDYECIPNGTPIGFVLHIITDPAASSMERAGLVMAKAYNTARIATLHIGDQVCITGSIELENGTLRIENAKLVASKAEQEQNNI